MNAYSVWAERRVASRKASVKRETCDPKRIAARASEHRANAETHLRWLALSQIPDLAWALTDNVDHRAAAEREFTLAYETEN